MPHQGKGGAAGRGARGAWRRKAITPDETREADDKRGQESLPERRCATNPKASLGRPYRACPMAMVLEDSFLQGNRWCHDRARRGPAATRPVGRVATTTVWIADMPRYDGRSLWLCGLSSRVGRRRKGGRFSATRGTARPKATRCSHQQEPTPVRWHTPTIVL